MFLNIPLAKGCAFQSRVVAKLTGIWVSSHEAPALFKIAEMLWLWLFVF